MLAVNISNSLVITSLICGEFKTKLEQNACWVNQLKMLNIFWNIKPTVSNYGPPLVKCWLLIHSIFMQWISDIFHKCYKLNSMLEIKSQHLTWVGLMWVATTYYVTKNFPFDQQVTTHAFNYSFTPTNKTPPAISASLCW